MDDSHPGCLSVCNAARISPFTVKWSNAHLPQPHHTDHSHTMNWVKCTGRMNCDVVDTAGENDSGLTLNSSTVSVDINMNMGYIDFSDTCTKYSPPPITFPNDT